MKVEWKSCFRIGLSVFLLYLCITYWNSFTEFVGGLIGAAMPLLIGCVIAYILNILMSFYERHYFPKSQKKSVLKSRRPVCMLSSFITLILVIILLWKMVVPELVACVELLIAQVPGVINSVVDWLKSMNIVSEDLFAGLKTIDWGAKIQQIVSMLTSGVGNVMGSAITMVTSVFSSVVTALFALIFSIYLLIGKETLGNQVNMVMKRYMKESAYSKTTYVLSVLNDCFHKYIVGQCIEAVILGALCAVGMWILGFPYAVMTGAVIAFTALIPVAGGYIGAAVGAFMILTVSPIKAILFLVYIVVLQQLEGNLIYPRVVGSSMGLPAIWVLAAVTVGGGMMGIIGMLIGVPIAAAFYRLIREDVKHIPQKKNSVTISDMHAFVSNEISENSHYN